MICVSTTLFLIQIPISILVLYKCEFKKKAYKKLEDWLVLHLISFQRCDVRSVSVLTIIPLLLYCIVKFLFKFGSIAPPLDGISSTVVIFVRKAVFFN